MTFLPIVTRELRAAARRNATYRNRVLAAGIAFVFAISILLFESVTRMRVFGPLRGKPIFDVLCWLAFVFCHFEAFRKTTDAISGEKRDGTLGLLFLTDLKGYDIVLGKLASTSLESLYGLLGILPVLGLPLLMGGVTGTVFWQSVLALVNILFFALAVGILVSSLCRKRQTVTAVTLGIFFGVNVVPMLIPVREAGLFSPWQLMNGALDGFRSFPGAGFAESIGAVGLVGLLSLIGASFAAPRFWQEGEALGAGGITGRIQSTSRLARKAKARTEQLNQNPILWLANRQSPSPIWISIAIAAALCIGCVILVANTIRPGIYLAPPLLVFWVLNFLPLLRLANKAPRFFIEARRTGSLELILSTPLGVDDILSGQRQALEKSCALPIVLVLLVEVTIAILTDPSGTGLMVFILVACYYVLQAFAIANAGMWFGLTCKSETAAVSRTLVLVLLLPIICMPFCFLGAPFVIGIPIFWSAYAGGKLRAELRSRASQPLAA